MKTERDKRNRMSRPHRSSGFKCPAKLFLSQTHSHLISTILRFLHCWVETRRQGQADRDGKRGWRRQFALFSIKTTDWCKWQGKIPGSGKIQNGRWQAADGSLQVGTNAMYPSAPTRRAGVGDGAACSNIASMFNYLPHRQRHLISKRRLRWKERAAGQPGRLLGFGVLDFL